MFDILVLGGLAMALFWFFKRKRLPLADQKSVSQGHARQPSDSRRTVIRPCKPQVDHRYFLNAARDIFVRMKNASNAGRSEEIRKFCTDKVADQIIRDIDSQGAKQSHTEVTTLNAEITETWIEADLEWVSVQFTAMLHEQERDAAGSLPDESAHEVCEDWTFRHDPGQQDPTWYLADIQQAD